MRRSPAPMIAVVLVLVVASATESALAQPQDRERLAESAARALDDLRYEEAYELYEKLEQAGGASAAELALIYQRLAEIAASIRQEELATQQYLKLLAVAPDFSLPSGAPEVFAKALGRARQQRGPLAVLEAKVVASQRDRSLTVILSRDTLKLVSSVSATESGPDGATQSQRRSKELRFWFQVKSTAATSVRVRLLDAYGNTLRELPAQSFPPARAGVTAPAPAPRVDERMGSAPSAWYQRPSVWLGVGAVVAGGVGLGFGLAASSKESELDDIASSSSDFTLADYQRAEDSAKSRALGANIAFAMAGGLAVGAVVIFLLESDDDAPAVGVAPASSGGVVTLGGRF